MSLLDKASLVVTPNSYKESKLYSVVPNTTLGDMDVVRATTATRVNSAGLIEVVPRNLFQYSEAISTSPWALVRATVSTNSINSPTGTLTADTLVSNITGSDGSWTRQIVSAINGNFNMSIYAKQGTSPFLQVRLDGLGAVIFNLSNGTVKLSSSGIIGSITSVGSDGWYRCSISGTATGQTTALFIVGNSSMNLVTWFATNGDSVYLWGAQVEQGSLTEYFPTTTRLNIPRIDYTNGSCPSLLVEPQRTNLLTNSEDFDNINWLKLNATITPNVVIAPNGTLTADLLVCVGSAAGTNYIRQVKTISATTHTLTFFAKPNASSIVKIAEAAFTGQQLDYNLANNTISGGGSQVSGAITEYVNGWKKITFTYIYTAGQTNCILNINSLSCYIWGAQLEVGSYPTSYIPTVASSVTRNADVISKTGITDLIGQTEGTLFYDIDLKSRVSYNYIAINNGTATNYIGIYITPTNLQLETYVASTLQTAIVFTNSSIGRFKIAAGYKNNDFVLYVNGNLIGTDLIASVPTCNKLDLTAFNQANSIGFNSVQLYKTKLSNTELQSLTTL